MDPSIASYPRLVVAAINLLIGIGDQQDMTLFGKYGSAIFIFSFRIILLSVLSSMYINKYDEEFKDLEVAQLESIIELKKSIRYDK